MSYIKMKNQKDTNNIIKSITPDLYKRHSQLEYDTKERPSFYFVTTTFFIPGKSFSADEFSRKSEKALQSAIDRMFMGYDKMYRHLCSMILGNHWDEGSKREAQPYTVCFIEIGGKPWKGHFSLDHPATIELGDVSPTVDTEQNTLHVHSVMLLSESQKRKLNVKKLQDDFKGFGKYYQSLDMQEIEYEELEYVINYSAAFLKRAGDAYRDVDLHQQFPDIRKQKLTIFEKEGLGLLAPTPANDWDEWIDDARHAIIRYG